ncbi:MAG: hypothetical protein ACRDV3_15835 [Acidothermaceae bacterium]
MPTSSEPLVDVRLLSVPIPIRERSTEHGEELLREMTLIAFDAANPTSDVPARIVALADQVRGAYSEFTLHPNGLMDAAAEAGVPVLDEVVYRVPVSTGAFCQHIADVIDEADAYCRDGEYLLTLATPPDVLAYQHWILGEFIRQTAGGPPTAWPDYTPS